MNSEKLSKIAYCGLYCAECFAHLGDIADYSRDLRKELRKHRFEKTAEVMSGFFKELQDYESCYKVLGTLVKLRCKKGCRTGGGNPQCKIRSCCQRKKLDGCWQCTEFETCKKLEFLAGNHGDAHTKNLRKLSKKGIDAFLEGKKLWYHKPKEQ